MQRRGIGAVLDDLHEGRDCGPAWSLALDASAVALARLSLSGLWRLLDLEKRRRAGLQPVLVGAAAVVAAFAFGAA